VFNLAEYGAAPDSGIELLVAHGDVLLNGIDILGPELKNSAMNNLAKLLDLYIASYHCP
jgi:hypothetical protein